MERNGRPRALLAWSSGKDSAWALRELRRAGEAAPVPVTLGETVEREGFVYADLLPAGA